jgi:hypothetical protein
MSLIGYFNVKPTSKKFEFFEVYKLGTSFIINVPLTVHAVQSNELLVP